ncbi:MAG: hypothetical protein BGO70_12890 [Bacteroidetes bacterium 43-93]|nr:hypothetical protein [Bacteroidota bacterium]OJW99337.1 MAG: hypothetical protein BGO70_12890 [Bacteroidetes bacterium 43-93]
MVNRSRFLLILLLLLFTANRLLAAHIDIPFMGSIIVVTDSTEAAGVIGKDDGYPEKFTRFDIQSRLGDNATWKDYLPFAQKQVENWSLAEVSNIRKAFEEISKYCVDNKITWKLPSRIYLLKSNTKEEFEAEGYTRDSCIILNPSVLGITTGLAAHELFHVFSRYNPKKRDDLYYIFGFKKCNPIALAHAMRNRNITNPDCPVVSHYITVNGKDMTLVLYSKKDYETGKVFEEYVKVGLLMLTGDEEHKAAQLTPDGFAVVKEISDEPTILKQIGTNTPYMLHPEEICAEHFSLMITNAAVNQPEKIAEFKKQLQQQ